MGSSHGLRGWSGRRGCGQNGERECQETTAHHLITLTLNRWLRRTEKKTGRAASRAW